MKTEVLVYIVSLDWRIRSYLKAELAERNLETVCLENVEDLKQYLQAEDKVKLFFIDWKGQSKLDMLEDFDKMLISLDPPDCLEHKSRVLKRPLTISDCIKEILGGLK